MLVAVKNFALQKAPLWAGCAVLVAILLGVPHDPSLQFGYASAIALFCLLKDGKLELVAVEKLEKAGWLRILPVPGFLKRMVVVKSVFRLCLKEGTPYSHALALFWVAGYFLVYALTLLALALPINAFFFGRDNAHLWLEGAKNNLLYEFHVVSEKEKWPRHKRKLADMECGGYGCPGWKNWLAFPEDGQ